MAQRMLGFQQGQGRRLKMLSPRGHTRSASAVDKPRLESDSPEQQLQALGWAGVARPGQADFHTLF